jgi:alkylation response protein AidB-like acyl-CoA dehydrogenase
MNIPVATALAARPIVVEATAEAVKAVADLAFGRAEERDADGAFPDDEITELHRAGLLTAPLPLAWGGFEPSAAELTAWLRCIGGGSLSLGRLYEGHVNALALMLRYGDEAQIGRCVREAEAGQLFGVWNTDDADGLGLVRQSGGLRLRGRKILCSGAGFIARPVITATDEAGRRLMVTPRLDDAERADLSQWTPQGMRASATGAVEFTGLEVDALDILGDDGDYERQPFFSGGAWRFCAVHLGGIEKLFDLLRQHLKRTRRGADPHQAARLGEAAIAVETARLWVEQAARMAHEEASLRAPEQIVAYVNLARLGVEHAGLTLLELAHRSVGLQSFMRPSPIERISRDLATYLRQPGPDRALTNAAAWLLEQAGDASEIWS